MRLGRRSFLKGLVAATVLSPMLAQVAPPRFLVATSMADAVTPLVGEWGQAESITFSETLTADMVKRAVKNLKQGHVPPFPDGYYHMVSDLLTNMPPAEYMQMSGEALRKYGRQARQDPALQFESKPFTLDEPVRGIPVEYTPKVNSTSIYGIAGYKIVSPYAPRWPRD